MLILLTIVLLLPALGLPQTDKSQTVWEPLKFLVGSWEGTGKGRPGSSRVQREYHFVLGDKFLQVKNKSTYPPQKENPKGEVHEDWGLFSYDRDREQFVLRQFHVEGFVNQYRLDPAAGNSRVFSFVTESIENIPSGWRARETYRIVNANEFIETFELAAPGREFEVYTETHFKKKT
jgi:hypothetical protein